MMLLHKSCLPWKGRTWLQLGEMDGLELFGRIVQAALKSRTNSVFLWDLQNLWGYFVSQGLIEMSRGVGTERDMQEHSWISCNWVLCGDMVSAHPLIHSSASQPLSPSALRKACLFNCLEIWGIPGLRKSSRHPNEVSVLHKF